jgi:aminomethyltransferase
LTPRNVSTCEIGHSKYVLITSETGGIINDPVFFRLGENHFWFSIADSDVLLWAKGVAVNSDLDVRIHEPDVSPLQIQGPRSVEIMQSLFGEDIRKLLYFRFREMALEDIPLIVSRTGWSNELGYELFLRDSSRGEELWQRVMEAGKSSGLRAGHTSTIRRVEAALLSYRADMDIDTNPYELGLGRLVDLDMEAEFIGKAALRRIKAEGNRRQLVGLKLSGLPLESPNTRFWPLFDNDEQVGNVTSAVYSPRLDRNIALAMVATDYASIGSQLRVFDPADGAIAEVVDRPFIAPPKQLTQVFS